MRLRHPRRDQTISGARKDRPAAADQASRREAGELAAGGAPRIIWARLSVMGSIIARAILQRIEAAASDIEVPLLRVQEATARILTGSSGRISRGIGNVLSRASRIATN